MTATRWRGIFEELGHRARIVEDAGGSFDVVVALHAGKSAAAIRRSRERYPSRPIVVALTGTDLYRDILEGGAARRSLDLADRLVVLHDRAPDDVPAAVRRKTRVIRQSVEPQPRPVARARRGFDVALVAHARPEKDPLLPAKAALLLPEASRVRIVHAGRALSVAMERLLVAEAKANPRYTWLGELGEARTRALIARSRLLVLSSVMEGGANVLGEAIVSGTPSLASRIPASVAALGPRYPGLFRAGDAPALARLLVRAEKDPAFLRRLAAASDARRALFAPSAERTAWRRLLAELGRMVRHDNRSERS